MKQFVLALVLLASMAVLYDGVRATPNDEAEIHALEQRFLTAFNAKDVNAVMANYLTGAELFVFDVEPPRQHVGSADFKKELANFFASTSGAVKLELTDSSVTTDGGSLAYSHSIQRVRGQMKDGKPFDVTLRVTDDFRKVHGKWLIAVEHTSVPVNLDTGQADIQSKP